MDMSKNLWDLANIITGFAVVQPLAVAVALGKDLAGFQHQPPNVKYPIGCIALLFGFGYCVAVHRCCKLGGALDVKNAVIWSETAHWRIACILLFTLVFVFGLFAPDILASKSNG